MSERVRLSVGADRAVLELLDPDDHVSRRIMDKRDWYKRDLLDDMRARVSSGTALDVGAHIGNHTIWMALACGLKVVALEPNPHTRAQLERNVALNGLKTKVEVLPVAAGDAPGQAVVDVVNPQNSGMSRAIRDDAGDVPIVTIDSLALEDVSLIKIDVEGAELSILEGAVNTLERCHPLLYIEAADDGSRAAVERFLAPFGYSCFGRYAHTPTYGFAAVGPNDVSLSVANVETAEASAPAVEPVGSDPLEAAAVRAGFLLVDAYERLGLTVAQRVFKHELDAWYEYARSTIADLEPWPSVVPHVSVYQNDNNRLRMRRVLDFLQPGDRVFDVGFGRGYLCGVLLRDGKIDAYHGIDIVPANVEATKEMLVANGFTDRAVVLEIGDLYELTREKVASTGAGLMICCEVLEHVKESERALRTLAQALPDGADLLFSVPLNGRLESVWGHLTVFDVSRIKSMARNAGLTVHHIEPIANAWTLVVASRDPASSPRVRAATTRPSVDVSTPLSASRDFIDVPPADLGPGRVAGAKVRLEPTRYKRTICHIEPRRGVVPRFREISGGVSFPVASLTAMRLDLDLLESGANIKRVIVEAKAGKRTAARWVWTLAKVPKKTAGRFSFREDFATAQFKRESRDAFSGIDVVHVTVELRSSRAAAFSIRAAYLP